MSWRDNHDAASSDEVGFIGGGTGAYRKIR